MKVHWSTRGEDRSIYRCVEPSRAFLCIGKTIWHENEMRALVSSRRVVRTAIMVIRNVAAHLFFAWSNSYLVLRPQVSSHGEFGESCFQLFLNGFQLFFLALPRPNSFKSMISFSLLCFFFPILFDLLDFPLLQRLLSDFPLPPEIE